MGHSGPRRRVRVLLPRTQEVSPRGECPLARFPCAWCGEPTQALHSHCGRSTSRPGPRWAGPRWAVTHAGGGGWRWGGQGRARVWRWRMGCGARSPGHDPRTPKLPRKKRHEKERKKQEAPAGERRGVASADLFRPQSRSHGAKGTGRGSSWGQVYLRACGPLAPNRLRRWGKGGGLKKCPRAAPCLPSQMQRRGPTRPTPSVLPTRRPRWVPNASPRAHRIRRPYQTRTGPEAVPLPSHLAWPGTGLRTPTLPRGLPLCRGDGAPRHTPPVARRVRCRPSPCVCTRPATRGTGTPAREECLGGRRGR